MGFTNSELLNAPLRRYAVLTFHFCLACRFTLVLVSSARHHYFLLAPQYSLRPLPLFMQWHPITNIPYSTHGTADYSRSFLGSHIERFLHYIVVLAQYLYHIVYY